jgi:hypothetical protein
MWTGKSPAEYEPSLIAQYERFFTPEAEAKARELYAHTREALKVDALPADLPV